MQITREKEIVINDKKEIVRVTFDIPSSAFKTKDEVMEECGDIGLKDRTAEQLLDETFGAICNSLSMYLTASLYCGYHSGDALLILQNSILDSGISLREHIKEWKKTEKMS